jgi:hypothetical protein
MNSSSLEPRPEAVLEAQLRTLLAEPLDTQLAAQSARVRPGRPATLPAAVLWLGLLVGVLQGITTQRGIWRLLSVHGLWSLPPFPVVDQAFYNRLQRLSPDTWAECFRWVTAALLPRLQPRTAVRLASFAPRIIAFDHTSLDPVQRKLPAWRSLRPGHPDLLPGALACAFDVRLQIWLHVVYQEVVGQPWDDFRTFLQTLEPGCLLLTDLGFFSFEEFDQLLADGHHFVSRLRQRVTCVVHHCFYDLTRGSGKQQVRVVDRLVYLGVYRANRMGRPVRLIEIQVGEQTYRYVTDILEPERLPAWQVVALYARRWDIESGFQLVKTYLGLSGLWSGHRKVLLHQVFATFLVAQIVLGFRTELAQRAECDVQEVSVRLLVEWLPRLAQQGRDPLAELVRTGRQGGYIRPFRGKKYEVPEPGPDEIAPAPESPPRKARYPKRTVYLARQKQLREEKRARGEGASRPYGRQPKEL